jgi:hypothetical protein
MLALMKDSVGSNKPGGLKNMENSSEKEGEKHVVQAITRKPCTKLINKLRSNAKIRLNPVLKDLVINVDENESEDEDSAQVSRSRYTWLTDRNKGKLQQVGARF